MQPGVSTCLWFEKDAEAAAHFYCSLLPGSDITRVFRQGADADAPAFLVEFTLNGQQYQAMNGGPHYRLSPAASIVVMVDTQTELDRLWSALLSDGGQESRCGWLTDRYGLSWQILPRALHDLMSGPGAGAVLLALRGMIKLDIAALQAAAD
jgi:predicted 3-demethylubiquinone-9 3-methyltransferase (glyoxalase superfamily)